MWSNTRDDRMTMADRFTAASGQEASDFWAGIREGYVDLTNNAKPSVNSVFLKVQE